MTALTIIAKYHAESFRKLIDHSRAFVASTAVVVDDDHEDGIMGYRSDDGVMYIRRPLAGNFSAQRNAGIELALEGRSDIQWLLTLDTDEDYDDWFWRNMDSILRGLSSEYEAVYQPRANYTVGQSANDKDFLGWPDIQCRLMRSHLRWRNRLHEWPTITKSIWRTPMDVAYAVRHNKTANDQERANHFYQAINPNHQHEVTL